MFIAEVILYAPFLVLYFCAPSQTREIINSDSIRWIEDNQILIDCSKWRQLMHIVAKHNEFRNLFRYRLCGSPSKLLHFGERILRIFFYGERTLFIKTPSIGKGLRIQHGFATIINAKSIGENCWVNQQVTIGYTNKTDSPVIGDNVRISAGAKVLGEIRVGDNVIVGANAVVIKNVPDNCTVGGVPAKIIKGCGCKN